MLFHNPLQKAVLLKRYKRFLADVCLSSGEIITIHCPNTGAMTGCAEPGSTIWMSDSKNPKRKYRYTWELTETSSGHRICVNTQRANTVAGEVLSCGLLEPLGNVNKLVAEQKYGYDNRRIDWLAQTTAGQTVYIEVKSVTLAEGEQGFFPDTKSDRAIQHLRSLQHMIEDGHRAVVLYVVLHDAITTVAAAQHIHPEYSAICAQAQALGVEFYAVGCNISTQGIFATHRIPVKNAN